MRIDIKDLPENLKNFNNVKKYLRICVRPTKEDNSIKRSFLDLECAVKLIFPTEDDKFITIPAIKDMLEFWNVNEDELIDIAIKNSKDTHVIRDMMNVMHIIMSTDNYLGASALLNEDILQAASDLLGGDFYILPSSIHELIILPYNDEFDIDYLLGMVKCVNSECVDEKDFLSNSVYFYNSEEGIISLFR